MKHAFHVAALVAAFGAGSAAAINKCVVDGKPVFQDAPCDEQRETAAQTRARELRNEAYHRELDRLAAQGVGLQRETPQAPAPQAKRDAGESEMFQPKSRSQLQMEREAARRRQREETERRNAESAARLTRMIDEMAERCGGDPKQVPRVGMSDAQFRECTFHARFGGVRQVVAIERDHKALRLYVFTNEPHRVYSVDGVVTAITP